MHSQKFKRVMIISMAYTLTVTLVLSVLAPYFSSRGFSDTWISWVFGIFSFVSIFAGLWASNMSYIGRTWLIRSALLINCVAFCLYLYGTATSILIGRVIDAFGYSVVAIMVGSKLQDSLDHTSRGKFTGIALSASYVVHLIGPIIGGVLADIYIGLPFMTSIGLMLALVAALRSAHTHHVQKPHSTFSEVSWFFKKSTLRPMFLLGPSMNAMQPLVIVFMPLFVVNTLQLSYASVGIALGAAGVPHLLQFIVGNLSDRYGRRKFIVLGTILRCASLASIAFVESYVALLVVLFLYGLGGAIWNVSAVIYMADQAESEHKQAAVTATYYAISQVGVTIGFVLAAVIASAFPAPVVFLTLGISGVAAACIAALIFATQYAHKG